MFSGKMAKLFKGKRQQEIENGTKSSGSTNPKSKVYIILVFHFPFISSYKDAELIMFCKSFSRKRVSSCDREDLKDLIIFYYIFLYHTPTRISNAWDQSGQN